MMGVLYFERTRRNRCMHVVRNVEWYEDEPGYMSFPFKTTIIRERYPFRINEWSCKLAFYENFLAIRGCQLHHISSFSYILGTSVVASYRSTYASEAHSLVRASIIETDVSLARSQLPPRKADAT
jgi:hypothetical protein